MTRAPLLRHYLAIFLVSFSLLMLEITVARILSVALFSHYAFVAISLAMFGLGLSGLVVYVLPDRFPSSAVDEQIARYSALFAIAAALSVLAFLHTQVVQDLSLAGFLTLGFAYGVLTVPFFLGGLCISLLMTHFSSHISRIYYADLVGASLGCVAVVLALNAASAPHVAVYVSVLVAVVSVGLAFRSHAGGRMLPLAALATTLVLAGLAVNSNLFTMKYVKSWNEHYSAYETWNAFSRVSAFDFEGNAAQILPLKKAPQAYAGDAYPDTMMLDIDGAAWTPMMEFDGDLSSIQFLRESALYLAHTVKPDSSVLVIGTGGGRDLLAALVFEQPAILGIEINPLMHRIVEERYGKYSGHPYTHDGVEVILDEARSRLTSIDQTFGIIQLSLIDTFSLNAAGGFVFSENYLYTTEAFQEYFRHLDADGVLSLTRYFVPRYPLEILRLTVMARAAWEAEGIERFADHVVVVKQGMNATMLVKRSPYSDAEIGAIEGLAHRNSMTILYNPRHPTEGHEEIASLVTTPDWQKFIDDYDFIIDPPVDDQPFFFNFLRGLVEVPTLRDDPFRFLKLWNDALVLMYMLIGVVTTMAVLCFAMPLLIFGRRQAHQVSARVAAPILLYFGCLGYGFLMIEIPLLQRFVLFLGYPVYSLAVVLFALLLFSGIGSLASARFTDRPTAPLRAVLLTIIGLALLYVPVVPAIINTLLGTPIALRILVTVTLLAPIGFVLGMAYPLGITILRGFGEELVPWAWGLNGALSVVASVFATFLGSRVGFTVALMTGVGAYALALGMISLATRTEASRAPARTSGNA